MHEYVWRKSIEERAHARTLRSASCVRRTPKSWFWENEGFALHTLNLSSLCTNVYVGRGVGRSCHVWDMNVGDSNG